jgi:hypothetical protein
MVGLAAATDDSSPTYALLASSVAAVGTYAAMRVAGATGEAFTRWRSRRGAPDPYVPPALVGDVHADLATLEQETPLTCVQQDLRRIEAWSIDLPLVAVSLLVPLTLHFLVSKLLGSSTESFAFWIRVSLVIVGHAHLALAALAVRFGRKLREAATRGESLDVHREWGKTLAIVVGVSALPGVLFFVVPPALSALTGLAFIPFMYIAANACLRSERMRLALATEEIAVPELLRVASPPTTPEPLADPLVDRPAEPALAAARSG